jgi:hypothetical protein
MPVPKRRRQQTQTSIVRRAQFSPNAPRTGIYPMVSRSEREYMVSRRHTLEERVDLLLLGTPTFHLNNPYGS